MFSFPMPAHRRQEKLWELSRQGEASEDALMKDIIAVLKPGRPVTCSLLRDMMRPLYPPTIAITAQDVWNMRLKVKKLLFEAESSTIDTSQCLDNPENDPVGVDLEFTLARHQSS
jgi:hypothetical protein